MSIDQSLNPSPSQSTGLHFNQSDIENGATVLIVDDSPDNLRVLSATLSESNYDIRCAKSGTMALKAIAKGELPDVILLDIQMPDIDGYEVCEQLKSNARTQHVPIIFISALDTVIDKVKAFSVGGADYITKPFQMEEVIARVQNQLKLQAAKAQLAQSEKMASLGQLVAGIAHEINNPIGFVQGNVDFIERYVQDVLTLLEAYSQICPDPPDSVKAIAHQIDLDLIREDLPKAIRSIKLGTERVISIVTSLRNFSRLDESAYKRANIHDGIEGTLLILDSRLKPSGDAPRIELIKDFASIEAIDCFPGSLNQVFMNLLANAIDAVDHRRRQANSTKVSDYRPQIRVATRQSKLETVVRIRDNGSGMSDRVKARLFTPFFTTKPVGSGTGLGLSISYQIIHEQHQGQLRCESEEGVGTEFTIVLPGSNLLQTV